MATSEERREVAEQLRDWADRYPQGDFTWGVLGIVHYRIDGVDTRPSSDQEVLYMLADLIDPTCNVSVDDVTHRPTLDAMAVRVYACDRCHAVSYIGEVCCYPEPRYCPNCGARVVSGDGE